MKKNIFIFLGLLDIISFVQEFDFFKNIEVFNFTTILMLMLIISLLLSGVFFILKKKWALILYYVQFPFKIGFLILSFGFLFDLFKLNIGTSKYNVVLGIIVFLEILRLIYSIIINRRISKK